MLSCSAAVRRNFARRMTPGLMHGRYESRCYVLSATYRLIIVELMTARHFLDDEGASLYFRLLAY